MATLLRLLRILHRYNSSIKTSITKVNFESSFNLNAILHTQATFLTNQINDCASTVYAQTTNFQQDGQENNLNNIDKKMAVLTNEIQRFGRIANFSIEILLQDIKKYETVSSLQGLFLLRCCSEFVTDKSTKSRLKLGIDLWRTLKRLNVALDVSHYNALLSVYTENEHEFSPLDFLEEMINENIQPNSVTFQKLISQFCKQGKVKEATTLLEYIEKEKISINEEMFSSFIWGHFINNDMAAALDVLKEMESLKIPITIKTYSTLMYIYAKKGDIESIRKILKECETKEIFVSNKVLLTIVYHLSLSNFPQFIDEILSMTGGSMYEKEANIIIYKLLSKQQETAAFQIFQTFQRNKKMNGNFFIQTLINFDLPIENCIKYCQIMEEEGITEKAFAVAISKTFASNMYESSIILLKAWEELGGDIKESYFYPVLKAYAQIEDYEGIEKVLKKMILDFYKTKPSIYMLKSHILPYLQCDVDKAFNLFENCQIPAKTAGNACVLHLLTENKIREAIKFMTKYDTKYKSDLLKHNLIQAFKNTEDAPSFVWILHYLYRKDINSYLNDNVKNVDKKCLSELFLESCILEVINFQPNNKYLNTMLFRNLVDKGITISSNLAEKIEKILGETVTTEISDALSNLKSGNLILKPIQTENYTHCRRFTEGVEKLESTAKLLTVSNRSSANYLKMKLLSYYCKTLNEKKAEELMEELVQNDVKLQIGIHSLLINMYIHLDKIDEAVSRLNKIRTEFPEFRLTVQLNLKLATALVVAGRIEEAQECLAWPTLHMPFPVHHVYLVHLLQAVAKYDDVQLLQKFFTLLHENGYFDKPSYILFQPLIQLYLDRGDRKAALETFESVFKTYNLAACKFQLLKQFVFDKDNQSLERITKICLPFFGKSKFYFDVAMAHLHNNNLDLAKNIIKDHCSNVYEEYVLNYAEHFYAFDETTNLERLFNILNDLKYDVEKLCVLLLKSYSIKKEWEKGFNLWTRMQEYGIKPSPTFMKHLTFTLNKTFNEGNNTLNEFNIALENDPFKAEELLDNMPKEFKSECYSSLCKKYTLSKNFSEVVELWRQMYEQHHLNIDQMTGKYILSKMAKEKSIECIEVIGTYLSPLHKKELKYNYYLNQAYMEAGAYNVFLKRLETKLENGLLNMNDIIDIDYEITVKILQKHPELYEQYQSLAYKFLKKGIKEPLYALWIYNFLQKDPKADEIWNKYIRYSTFTIWSDVFHLSNYKNDPELYLKLIEYAQQTPINQNFKLSLYTKLIRNCINLEHPKKYEYGLKCLQVAMNSNLCMGEFDINLLVKLQNGLEQSGISWPWSTSVHKIDQDIATFVDDVNK